MRVFVFTALVFFAGLLPAHVSAQEIYNGDQGTFRAEVISASELRDDVVPGTDLVTKIQELTVRFEEGPQKGTEVPVLNEFELDLREGDTIYVQHWIDIGGTTHYTLQEVQRSGGVAILFAIFAIFLIVFGGFQGFRALIALVGSLLAIIYILVPLMLAGHNPILVSIGVATIVLFLALFFTHGFNRTSLAAFLGTVAAVCATGVFAWFAIDFLHLSGVASEDEVYLNFNTGGALDFVGLLLGAIIIGVLGALDDIAITQAAMVRELYGANKDMPRLEAFTRAMRVGKDHVSALVNTLVLAYTGASLPLLLLFLQQGDPLYLFNIELFATEIVRMIVGSIGLILAVPFTTFLAIYLLENFRGKELGPNEHSHAHCHGHSH